MGASITKCETHSINFDSIILNCKTGKISEVSYLGIYERGSTADLENSCYTGSEPDPCSSISSKTENEFYSDVIEPCVNDDNCYVKGLKEKLRFYQRDNKC